MRTPKKATIEVIKSKISRAKELIIRGIEAKLKILAEENI